MLHMLSVCFRVSILSNFFSEGWKPNFVMHMAVFCDKSICVVQHCYPHAFICCVEHSHPRYGTRCSICREKQCYYNPQTVV